VFLWATNYAVLCREGSRTASEQEVSVSKREGIGIIGAPSRSIPSTMITCRLDDDAAAESRHITHHRGRVLHLTTSYTSSMMQPPNPVTSHIIGEGFCI
jgi:hypothetical protein